MIFFIIAALLGASFYIRAKSSSAPTGPTFSGGGAPSAARPDFYMTAKDVRALNSPILDTGAPTVFNPRGAKPAVGGSGGGAGGGSGSVGGGRGGIGGGGSGAGGGSGHGPGGNLGY